MPALHGSALDAILPLLIAYERDLFDQGVELARALEDEELAGLASAHREPRSWSGATGLRETICLRRGHPMPGHARLVLPLHGPELPRLAEHPEITSMEISSRDADTPVSLPALPGVVSLRLARLDLQAPLVVPALLSLRLSGCSSASTGALGALPSLRSLEVHSSTGAAPFVLPAASPELRQLHVTHFPALRLPGGLGDLFAGLRWLSIGGCGLRELPEAVGALVNLERLLLADNQIEALPASIGALTRVERLNLAHNQLRALPDEIGGMAALRWLSLEGNPLERLSEGFGRLPRLGMLSLAGTKVRALPSAGLEQLHSLDIIGAPLEAAPPVEALPRLRQIFLRPEQRAVLEGWAKARPRRTHLKGG